MAYYDVRITAERNLPCDQLDPEDRASGPVGEYWIEIEAGDDYAAEDLGLEWFHDVHPINVPEDFRIGVYVQRLRP
jgi:hypothetical protein